MSKTATQSIYQFKITLHYIEPPIWRRIQVPANYTFLDLHGAIQNAMGWFDSHLHAFNLRMENTKRVIEIGVPSEYDKADTIDGEKTPITDYVTEPGQTFEYMYDFGDGWTHEVLFEEKLSGDKGETYPKCLAGERACPPEDCGGPPGYSYIVEVLQDPKHEEYEEIIEWLGGCAGDELPYKPDEFSAEKVYFRNQKTI